MAGNTFQYKCASKRVNIIIENHILYNIFFATGVYKKNLFKIVYSNGLMLIIKFEDNLFEVIIFHKINSKTLKYRDTIIINGILRRIIF